MDKITTTIKREWLKEIAGRRKRVEYREIKPYWDRRLSFVKVPFELRLINGMDLKAPEVTVIIQRVRKNSRSGEYALHIASVTMESGFTNSPAASTIARLFPIDRHNPSLPKIRLNVTFHYRRSNQ
jgi:hypothetical protein